METKEKDEIGIEGFKKIFELKDSIKKEIENYKNKKTMIHLNFKSFSKDKKKYKAIKFLSLNKEISIDEKNLLEFEYTKNKFQYDNEITEKIILLTDEKKQEYFINIKRHQDNYYNIFIEVENEQTFSLEVVFFFKNTKDSFENIIVNDTKIMSKEKFPKTIRYNLINISLANCIKLFDDYSDNKTAQLDKRQLNKLFNENSLLFNFINDNKKRIGKIFYIKQDKEIKDFNDEEKKILKEINAMNLNEKINSSQLIKNFSAFKESQNYVDKDRNIKGNYLVDLNEKFNNLPSLRKYYNKNPTKEDIEIIRALSILNILLYYNQEEWAHYLKIFIRETEHIFKNKNYLNNKDKMMILINYLTIVKSRPDYNDYKYVSFYELNEDSFFIKSELFYREIISKLTEDSSLFFFFLQLYSGSDIDYITLNNCYKIKHVSLTEIKTFLLSEYFYPYFFIFHSDRDIMAWNDIKTQIKNYNINFKIYSEDEPPENEYLINNTIKLTLIKFNEYANTNNKGIFNLNNFPRLLLNDDLNYLEKKNKRNENKKEDFIELFGDSEKEFFKYIFGDESIINNIIYSKGKDLGKLYNSELFIQNNFHELNKLAEEYKPKIVKTKIEKDSGKGKIYHYYDLNIDSPDLMI